MPVLRRLLLLPLLAPLLAVLVVAALNLRPWVSLRLLTWRSAPLPLGAWIALAGAGGAALSAGATSLALGEGAPALRRQVRRRLGQEVAEAWDDDEQPREREAPQARWEQRETPAEAWASAGGSRAPGEPAPTVAVPFRVVRRGEAPPVAAAERVRRQEPRREPMPEPVPAGDDWDATASDDW
ncbi:MAG: hypothetical protein ACK55X_07500 [Synechococcaceae cyanobacterium]